MRSPAASPGCRRSALVRNESYQAVPELAKVIGMLQPEKFDKMMSFLHSEAAKKVRTNNHVERANRRLRFCEKVRYKWRHRRWVVRFVVLHLDLWWRQAFATAQAGPDGAKDGYPGPATGAGGRERQATQAVGISE